MANSHYDKFDGFGQFGHRILSCISPCFTFKHILFTVNIVSDTLSIHRYTQLAQISIYIYIYIYIYIRKNAFISRIKNLGFRIDSQVRFAPHHEPRESIPTTRSHKRDPIIGALGV